MNGALSNDICHFDKMYLLMKGLESVHGRLRFEISRSSEAFAFTSVAALPDANMAGEPKEQNFLSFR